MTSDFIDRAPLVAHELVNELDPALQMAMASAGWGHPLELTNDGGNLNIEYFEFHEEHIFNNEYGSEGTTPNSVVRPFLTKAESTIKRAINDEALNYLFLKGILP